MRWAFGGASSAMVSAANSKSVVIAAALSHRGLDRMYECSQFVTHPLIRLGNSEEWVGCRHPITERVLVMRRIE